MQPPPTQQFVAHQPHKTALVYSSAELVSKSGEKKKISEVIKSNSVTLLLFGSPHYQKSDALVKKLKTLQERSKQLHLHLGIVYIPVFTYHETAMIVEDDFQKNHGDWWMMGFQSWEAVEAGYMHSVSVVPALVVVDKEGEVITECGQNDLEQYGNDVLITWF